MTLRKPLLDMLERMHCGGIILNGSGEVAHLNPAAERYLCKYANLSAAATSAADRTRALRRLIGARKGYAVRGADLRVPMTSGGEARLVLYSTHLPVAGGAGTLTVVTLVDLTEMPRPGERTLQKLFGLTPAETNLALEIARGLSLSEAAANLEIRIPTARSQLSSIFAKTETRRQGELIALLSRMAILP